MKTTLLALSVLTLLGLTGCQDNGIKYNSVIKNAKIIKLIDRKNVSELNTWSKCFNGVNYTTVVKTEDNMVYVYKCEYFGEVDENVTVDILKSYDYKG